MADDEVREAATALRRGTTRLARRLRMERQPSRPAEPELSNLALSRSEEHTSELQSP